MSRFDYSVFGRWMLAFIFLLSGLTKIVNFEQSEAYMAAQGMGNTALFLSLAIVIELAGAISLILGYYTRRGALLLALYLVPVTFVFHGFWNLSGMEQQAQLINFLKNVAIMGGLLYVVRVGALGFSLDRKLHTADEPRVTFDRGLRPAHR